MELASVLSSDTYTLAPQVMLTPEGVKTDWAMQVTDGRISEIGPAEQFEDVTSLSGKAIIPGFVDAHTHVGQIFGKALIGGEPAQIWRRIWHPMEKDMTEDECYITAKWAFWEALRGGFTKVVNYRLNTSAKNSGVHRAAKETGIRLVSACGLDEFAESSGTGSGKHSFNEISDLIKAHIEDCNDHALISPSVCCSSVIGNARQRLSALSDFCKDNCCMVQIHSNEHCHAGPECVLRFGMRPTELLHKQAG